MKTYAINEFHISHKNSSLEIFNTIQEVVDYLNKESDRGSYPMDELVVKQIVKTYFEVDAITFKNAHS